MMTSSTMQETKMGKYKDFSPTGLDSMGLGLPNRQDWLVAPVVRTRDSGPLEESNFEVALEILKGESQTWGVQKDPKPPRFFSRFLALVKSSCAKTWQLLSRKLGEPKTEKGFRANLDAPSQTVEVHRFGHWGPGWFEIILVHPSREKEVEDIERSLEDYPVLDDEDFSAKEYEAACDYWEACSLREKIQLCAKFGASIFSARQDTPPSRIDMGYLAQP